MAPKKVVASMAALLVTLAVAACGGLTPTSNNAAATNGSDCPGEPSQASTTPEVAVLKAVGAPSSAAEKAALAKVTAGSETEKANLLVVGVTGTSQPPNEVIDTQMVGDGPNSLFAGKNLDCKTAAVKRGVAKLAGGQPQSGLDILSAVRSVHQDLHGLHPSTVNVVVFASALQTVDADLADPSVLANPTASLNRLSKQGLNVSCKGWNVYLVGQNLYHGKPVSAKTEVELETWWSKYLQLCGGELVSYSTALTQFPLSAAVDGPDYASIKVTHTKTAVTATVASDALFATGSAHLLPGATRSLNAVVPLLAHAHGEINVTGYCDSTGTVALNRVLSQRRARAVADFLSAKSGLPASRFETVGAGSSDPVATNATAAGRAQNRRVVVVIPSRTSA